MNKVSLIIPIYNETKTVSTLLDKVLKLEFDKELIIINDGSTDDTSHILEKYENNPMVRIYHHTKNRGKGAAIRTGLKYVKGDIIVIQDADLELDPNDLHYLIKLFEINKINVVYGSRFLMKTNSFKKSTFFINFFLSKLTNLLYWANISDMETCYKLFRSHIASELNLKSNRFDIEPEITIKLIKLGYHIFEFPISYYPRSRKEGKKISWKDVFQTIFTLIRYKFHE